MARKMARKMTGELPKNGPTNDRKWSEYGPKMTRKFPEKDRKMGSKILHSKSPQTTKILTLVSAKTIRVLVAFSMVCLFRPPVPAIRPIARAKWSPFSVCLISVILKVSKNSSSIRINDSASFNSNPKVNARRKSVALCRAMGSLVCSHFLSSTWEVLVLKSRRWG